MHVLIVNQHTMNFGDDAAGVALVELLLDSDKVENISIVYNGGPETLPIKDERVGRPPFAELKAFGRLNIALYLIFKRVARLQGSGNLRQYLALGSEVDLVLVAPAGANIGIYSDWRFLFRLLLLVRSGASPVFHLNTIGRSPNRVFNALSRYVLRRSKLFVREAASVEYLRSIGVPSRLGPDTAFALSPLLSSVQTNRLTVVPSELDSWHPEFGGGRGNALLLGPIAEELAAFAQLRDLTIEILPHLRNSTEKQFNLLFEEALVGAGLDSDKVHIASDVNTFREYDLRLSQSRLVVGGRYHSIVLAAKNARPFISLSYENKMIEACRYLDMDDFSIDLQTDLTRGQFGLCLEQAFADHDRISARLRSIVAAELASGARMVLRDAGVLAN